MKIPYILTRAFANQNKTSYQNPHVVAGTLNQTKKTLKCLTMHRFATERTFAATTERENPNAQNNYMYR
ncbi:hypothetical protein HanIR_Chr09g0424881 [Helianthus annuus]|nr:hypothetical protein HanIR_Chr09g0424881 [Helianthus annuus]